jgi:hypothetical protein
MLAEIFAILAGLILLTGLFGVIPAFGEYIEKFAKFIGGFQGIIGIIALILGILNLGDLLLGLMLILAGILLAIGFLQAIPMAGESIKKIAKYLGGFQTIIGIVVLILGIWNLL